MLKTALYLFYALTVLYLPVEQALLIYFIGKGIYYAYRAYQLQTDPRQHIGTL